MAQILDSAKRAQWIKHTAKVVAVAASSGAALVSIVTALVSYGVIGQAESHQSIGNIGAAWVGLRPAIDTATAFGDTVHFAATVTDRNGSILVGARPTWTCLLYTSDAADDLLCVDLGGRRIIKKKK